MCARDCRLRQATLDSGGERDADLGADSPAGGTQRAENLRLAEPGGDGGSDVLADQIGVVDGGDIGVGAQAELEPVVAVVRKDRVVGPS
jgi:hypothetical protein